MSLAVNITKKLQTFTLTGTLTSQGERTALLGASGSGKSMFLKCLSGIETPDSGYIRVNGRILFDAQQKINVKPQKRRVGYLFQNYALFPNFTVRQNISCVLKDRSDQRRTEELLARFAISDVADQYAQQLSGGQQQRVALARLLASEPEILLLDEPFSALDTFLREKVELEMKEFLQEYRGDVVLVTHDRNEAYRLCDNLVVLAAGAVIEQGALKAIFQQPACLETAKLTGCKNFSAIERLGPRRLLAKDWGILLTTAEEITAGITHVGIRAHDFYETSAATENAFPVALADETETPFEWRFLCRPRGTGRGTLWWKQAKSQRHSVFSGYLAAAPASIQLLKDQGMKSTR